jgi:hypothetical protein
MKSIAKDPAHRFQDVNEFNREVKQLIASLTPVPGTPTGEKTEPEKKWPGIPIEIEMRQPKTLAFNKKQLAIASVFIGILIITIVLLKEFVVSFVVKSVPGHLVINWCQAK